MSADGDFHRECIAIAEQLDEAVQDIDRFSELVELFQRAANNVRLADAWRDATIWGADAEALERRDRERVDLADFGPINPETGDK